MNAIRKVAIVGAGIAGMATAIRCARAGIDVDVFELQPELSALGSGVSLQHNALQVFAAIGVWPDVEAAGFGFDGAAIRAPGPDASVLMPAPARAPHAPGELPSGMGIPRASLASILYSHACAAGARFHFGATVQDLVETDAGVQVIAGGAVEGVYDLVVGADGVHSRVREIIGIPERPESTGMGIWRAFVSRPTEVTTTELYYGGPMYIAGYTPTGENSMYAFIVEAAQDRFSLGDAEAAQIMHDESLAYGGPWEAIRADLRAGAHVNYTWFTKHLVPEPWNRGRVIIIGDAAHSCPPTIAQGAAQSLEDALVLTELLTSRDKIDPSLWDEFHARRLPRAQAVIDASVQVGQWQIDRDPDADIGALLGQLAGLMEQPA